MGEGKKELPKFKYNLKPLDNGIIVKRCEVCPVCGKETAYVYEGPFNSAENVENICPWCITNGDAAAKYSGKFQGIAQCEDVDRQEYVDELVHRTIWLNGYK